MIVCTGRSSPRSAIARSSRPASIASSRRSFEKRWRIFARARGVCANCNQSSVGPAASWRLVTISTESPVVSSASSGTRRPLARAPMQRWPTSVWMA